MPTQETQRQTCGIPFIIANTALRMPDSLRPVDRVDELFGRLKVLNGIDEDLTRAYTRMINQIRSALVGTFLRI